MIEYFFKVEGGLHYLRSNIYHTAFYILSCISIATVTNPVQHSHRLDYKTTNFAPSYLSSK
jgi:hypothetical protein